MRRISLFLLTLLTSVALCSAARYRVEQVPNVQLADASRYTSNPDGILSAEAVAAIDAACDSLHTLGKAQIAVVAVEDIEGDVFTFAHSLFSEWGVGGKESDNGLGVLLVTDKREIRFVTGYGLEGVLPDAICKRIQQRYMVEHLSVGDYSTGMVEGVAAIARLLSEQESLDAQGEEEDALAILGVAFGVLLFFIGVAIFVVWYSRKCPKCGKHAVVRVASTCLRSTRQYNLMEHQYRCRECGHIKTVREKVYKATVVATGGRGHGGGFGGGSFGGGFGGGSFGGGGAGSRF
ncbi:MAG: TPM domain-containing protein [Alistipes sp.]|nr:TPM domain-containing protein [Alistipes sp.]